MTRQDWLLALRTFILVYLILWMDWSLIRKSGNRFFLATNAKTRCAEIMRWEHVAINPTPIGATPPGRGTIAGSRPLQETPRSARLPDRRAYRLQPPPRLWSRPMRTSKLSPDWPGRSRSREDEPWQIFARNASDEWRWVTVAEQAKRHWAERPNDSRDPQPCPGRSMVSAGHPSGKKHWDPENENSAPHLLRSPTAFGREHNTDWAVPIQQAIRPGRVLLWSRRSDEGSSRAKRRRVRRDRSR